jgi:hypothetical protein
MIIGFTGTRAGIGTKQFHELLSVLNDIDDIGLITEVHHGCCVGADAEFVTQILPKWMAHSRFESLLIHARPSNMPGMTDVVARRASTTVHHLKPPLERNKDIVVASEIMIACPEGEEVVRSGTWSTIRYAKKRRPIVIVMPDGTSELFNWPVSEGEKS